MSAQGTKLSALLIFSVTLFGCGFEPAATSTDVSAIADGSGVWISSDNKYTRLARNGEPTAPLLPVAWSGGASMEKARGLTLDANSSVVFYNGTAMPVLSITTTSDTWQHRFASGWSTVANISYGGVAAIGDRVFATDMWTASPGTDRGIVRFRPSESTYDRHAPTMDFIDVSAGQDGRLYALRSDMRTVLIYDPNTMLRLATVVLAVQVRGIAANAAQEIIGVAWDGNIHRFTASGAIAESLQLGVGSLIDVDISSDGTIVAGTRTNVVALIDPSFDESTAFSVFGVGTTSGVFVAFDEPAL